MKVALVLMQCEKAQMARGFSPARVVLARAVRQGHGIVVIFGSNVQGAPTRRD